MLRRLAERRSGCSDGSYKEEINLKKKTLIIGISFANNERREGLEGCLKHRLWVPNCLRSSLQLQRVPVGSPLWSAPDLVAQLVAEPKKGPDTQLGGIALTTKGGGGRKKVGKSATGSGTQKRKDPTQTNSSTNPQPILRRIPKPRDGVNAEDRPEREKKRVKNTKMSVGSHEPGRIKDQ